MDLAQSLERKHDMCTSFKAVPSRELALQKKQGMCVKEKQPIKDD
jgi:hypothetical protein